MSQGAPNSVRPFFLAQDGSRFWTCLVVALVVLAAVPFLGAGRYWVSLLAEIMVLAMWALSLNLLVGYTGLISFGHAAYFGIGAYSAALAMTHISASLALGLVLGTLAAGSAALLVGYLSVRLPGVAFSMLTLAFAQAFYTVAFKWRAVTGGDDGLRGIPRPTVSVGSLVWDSADRGHVYGLTLVALLLSIVIVRRIIHSPFGAVLVAIRENEERARFVGFDTHLYKFGAFVLAGLLAGFAGTLFVLLKGFISPSTMHWTSSGQVLMMAILGGTGTLIGPIIGAAVYMGAQEIISGFTPHWMIFLGGFFMLVVLFAPGGICSLLTRALRGRAPADTAASS